MVPLSRRRLLPLLTLAVFALLTACGNNDSGKSAAPKSVEDRFAVRIGTRAVQMQVALHPAETQQGLMYRKTLAPDEGMLFVFAQPQTMSFWMRNTPIPLDIGYFDAAGELREVYPMHPHDERPVASRGSRMQFALEMNQGWFARAGVRPGDKLDLAAVSAAIRARGLNPASYGLR